MVYNVNNDNGFNPTSCMCLFQTRTRISNVVCLDSFVFNCLRCEVVHVVRFVITI